MTGVSLAYLPFELQSQLCLIFHDILFDSLGGVNSAFLLLIILP